MKANCGKWFMRKWDLTLHLQKHEGGVTTVTMMDAVFMLIRKSNSTNTARNTLMIAATYVHIVAKVLNIDLDKKDTATMITSVL